MNKHQRYQKYTDYEQKTDSFAVYGSRRKLKLRLIGVQSQGSRKVYNQSLIQNPICSDPLKCLKQGGWHLLNQ